MTFRTLAAAIAMCAVPARAGVVFNVASCTVSSANAGNTGGCSDTTTTGTQSSLANGLHMIGDATASFGGSGTTFSLTMDWGAGNTGTATGSASGTLPLNWSFTPTLSTITALSLSPFSPISYTLDFSLNGNVVKHESASGLTSGSAFTGSDSVAVSGPVTSWEVNLTVTDTSPNLNDQLRVQVPTSSVDINNSPAVPEPSGILLISPGLVWLILRRRSS